MTMRGAYVPPPADARPSNPFAAAIHDAKKANSPVEFTLAAAKLNEFVKADALGGSGGDKICANIFKGLSGADAGAIDAFRDLVIGDSSYSIQNAQYTQSFIEKLAAAAKGYGDWPSGTNT